MKPVHKSHKIKEDALVTGTFRLGRYLQTHTQQLLYGVGAVALILVIILTISKVISTREANSLKALAEANILYQDEKYEDAITKFDAVAQKYGGTNAQKEALYYKANSLYLSEQYEEAIPAFEKAYKKGNDLTKPTALKGVADCYLQQNKFAEAAEKYLELADKFKYEWSTVPSLIKAGLCYKKLGETQKAIEIYQRVVDNYEENPLLDEAKAQLFILKRQVAKN